MRKLCKVLDFTLLVFFNLLLGFSPLSSFIISFLMLLGLYSFRVYDQENFSGLNEAVLRVLAGSCAGIFAVMIVYVFFADSLINKASPFFLNLFFTTVFFPFIHKFEHTIYLKRTKPKNYLVIGRKVEVGKILDEITERSFGKLRFIEYINPSPEKLQEIVENDFYTQIKKAIKELDPPQEDRSFEEATKALVREHIVEGDSQHMLDAILVTDPKLESLVKSELLNYQKNQIEVDYLPIIAEKYLKRVPLVVAEKFKSYYEVSFQDYKYSPAKRAIDLLFSIVFLVLFSPIVAVCGLWILIENGMPVIFKQHRVGQGQKYFLMHKLRTLKNNSDENTSDKDFTLRDDTDKRVLTIGRFLRKFRLDESLQFYDVLKGTMSIVGPRPEMKEFNDEMKDKIPFYLNRLKAKPGITGWAQINYKYTTTLEEYRTKTEYDLYYIKNRTTLLDLQIMLKTIETMLKIRK